MTDSGQTLSFLEAVRQTLAEALEADERVFLLGEDIADPAGGVVKATKGLSTRFGVDRVRATPISEQAIVGAAIGAAIAGMRPVAEIMMMDFLPVCFDQVVNHAAKVRFTSGGLTTAPLTIRTVVFIGAHAGATHSQSLEALLMHCPGLKVVIPSTPGDAKGLLTSCIEDPDPCIFIEHRSLYSQRGPVPTGAYRIPLGEADIKRAGTDVSLITYGLGVRDCLAAADQLVGHGIDAEVLDLRSLVPLDIDRLVESVSRTGRAVIVHYGTEFAGAGAEISAVLSERLFTKLHAPVRRVAAGYAPISASPALEAALFPSADKVVAAVREVVGA